MKEPRDRYVQSWEIALCIYWGTYDTNIILELTFFSGTSWYVSVFLVVNAALGAGLLNFPAAYDQSGGILTANIIQCVSQYIVDIANSGIYYDWSILTLSLLVI